MRSSRNPSPADNSLAEGYSAQQGYGLGPHLPRQQPQPLVHRGQLRRHRRKTFRHLLDVDQFPAGIRHRARRRLRAAALGAARASASCSDSSPRKLPKLESQDDLRRRIDEAARYIPLENLALSTQCGFASVAAGNLLTADEQWRKLELRGQHRAQGLGHNLGRRMLLISHL